MGVEILAGSLLASAAGAASTAAGAVTAAAGAVGAAGTAAAGAVGTAGMAAAGAVGTAGMAAVGTIGSVAGAATASVAAGASAIGSASLTAGSLVAGSAVTVGGTVVGAATSAGGIIISAGGSIIGTTTGAIETVLAATAEMTAAAAAESTVLVGQIPVVGESLAGAIQTVGNTVGGWATQAGRTIGLSSKASKSLGTIVSGTTTNELNQQVLRPYNEVKDEITGLGDIKKNYKILSDIAHGHISTEELIDIAEKHKDEIIEETLKELDLPEIQQNLEFIKGAINGEISKEELIDIAVQELASPELRAVYKNRNLLNRIRNGQATKEEVLDFILDNAGIPKTEELRQLENIYLGNLDKDKLQKCLLNAMDIDNIQELDRDFDILKRISSGEIKPEACSTSSRGKDCILSAWTSEYQSGEFYDIKIPTQVISHKNEPHITMFFPSVLFNTADFAEGKHVVLHECSIQHIGEPIVYSVISFLKSYGVSFEIKTAFRTITIDKVGNQGKRVIDIYNKWVSPYTGRNISVLRMPQMFPYQYNVEDTMKIAESLMKAGAKITVRSAGDNPEFSFSIDLLGIDNGSKRDFSNLLTNNGFEDYEIDEIYDAIKDFGRHKIFVNLNYENAMGWADVLGKCGCRIVVAREGANTTVFEEYVKETIDLAGVDIYKNIVDLGIGWSNQTNEYDYASYSIYAGETGQYLYAPCYGRIVNVYNDELLHGFVSQGSIICDIENSSNIYHVISPASGYLSFIVDRYKIVNQGENICSIRLASTDELKDEGLIYAGYDNGTLFSPIEGSIIGLKFRSYERVFKDNIIADIYTRGKVMHIISPYDVTIGAYKVYAKAAFDPPSKNNSIWVEMYDTICTVS